jgi:hypothetical protein
MVTEVLSTITSALVLAMLSRVPRMVRGTLRHEMKQFCQQGCPLRPLLEAHIATNKEG